MHFLLVNAADRQDLSELRFAFRQRAGFVHGKGVEFGEILDGFGVADEDAHLRAATDADHHAHGRGEPECARTGDDEYGNRIGDGVSEPWLRSEKEPNNKRKRGNREHRRYEPPRDLVGQRLNGSAAALGLRHKIYDLREHRFAANTLGLHHNPARCVHRATRNFHTDDFLHRQRLAREHGFINGCAALHDFAVHGNFFARSHAQEVAGMHVIKRHILVARGRYAAGGLGRQTEQCLDRAAGALAGAEFELPDREAPAR